MSGSPVAPQRPADTARRARAVIILAIAVVAVIAATIALAAWTAPDDDSDAAAPTAPAVPVIDDQQAREIADVVTRSMFEMSPDTSGAQIAAFKANTCGDFTQQGLPNVIAFSDELKAQNRSSTVTIESLAVTPHAAATPEAQVLVAASWQSGDAVNQSRIVYGVKVDNGKTCIMKAQFL